MMRGGRMPGGQMPAFSARALVDPRRWGSTFTSLSEPEYAWYFFGNLAFFMGMQMQFILRGFLAFDLTDSASALGFISAAVAIPMLVVAPFGGVVADRMNKRTLLIVSQSAAMLGALLLSLLIILDLVVFWHLIAISFTVGIVFSFNMPARQALVPQLVPQHKLMNAIALQMGGMNLTRIVAPALGGALIAPVGLGWVYLTTFILFAVAVASELHLPVHGMVSMKRPKAFWADMAEGFRYIIGDRGSRRLPWVGLAAAELGLGGTAIVLGTEVVHLGLSSPLWYAAWLAPAAAALALAAWALPRLWGGRQRPFWHAAAEEVAVSDTIGPLLLLGLIFPLFAFPVQMLLPVFAEDVFDRGGAGLGLLAAMTGVGGLVGAIFAANLDRFVYKGRLMLAGGLLMGACLVLFALHPGGFGAALVFLALGNIGGMLFQTTNNTVIQANLPEEVRGRVMSVMLMSFGLMPLGTLPLSLAADVVGAPLAVAISSTILIVVLVAVLALSRYMRNLRVDLFERAELSPVQAANLVAAGRLTQEEADTMLHRRRPAHAQASAAPERAAATPAPEPAAAPAPQPSTAASITHSPPGAAAPDAPPEAAPARRRALLDRERSP